MIKIGVKADTWRHAGLLEGYVLSQDMKMHLNYFENHYKRLISAWDHVKSQKMANFDDLRLFFSTQLDSLRTRLPLALKDFQLVLEHLEGMAEGYNLRYASQIAKRNVAAISVSDLFLLNSYHELVDLGLFVNRQSINFGVSDSKSQYSKRNDRETTLLASLFLSGRVSASLLQFEVPTINGHRNITNARMAWENQPWYPMHFRRVLSRISVGSGVSRYGYQFVGFPGQVISMDSFSLSMSQKKLTTVLMRQADFSPALRAKPVPSSSPLCAWMLVSTAFHTPNITILQYINMWRQLKPSLVSTEWKTIAVADAEIRELETHYDVLQVSSILESLGSRNFHFTSPTFTLLAGQQAEDHGFSAVKHRRDEDTHMQTTTVDAYRHESLWNALKQPPDMNPKRILSTATSPTMDQIERDLRSKFDLDISRQVELIELSSLL